jgi:hypothetical protein
MKNKILNEVDSCKLRLLHLAEISEQEIVEILTETVLDISGHSLDAAKVFSDESEILMNAHEKRGISAYDDLLSLTISALMLRELYK